MRELYTYTELSQEAQYRAIDNYIRFIIETTEWDELHKNSNLYKAMKECEDMKTPWFIGEYIWEYDRRNIEKDLKRGLYNINGSYIEDKNSRKTKKQEDK